MLGYSWDKVPCVGLPDDVKWVLSQIRVNFEECAEKLCYIVRHCCFSTFVLCSRKLVAEAYPSRLIKPSANNEDVSLCWLSTELICEMMRLT